MTDDSTLDQAFSDVPSSMRPAPLETASLTSRVQSGDVPHSPDLEQAILGACLTGHRETLLTIASRCTAEDFYRPEHADLWRAITGLVNDGNPVTRVTLLHTLTQQGTLTAVGGAAYLQAAQDAAPLPDQVTYHLRILRELTAQRLLRSGVLATTSDLAVGATAHATAERLRGRLDLLPHAYEDDVIPVSTLINDVVDDLDARAKDPDRAKAKFVQTGYLDLDEVISGFERGRLVVLFGRSGMGKSTVALDWVRHAGLAGRRVAYFSLEMSTHEIMHRLLAAEANSVFPEHGSTLTLEKLTDRPQELTDADWDRLAVAIDRLSNAPIFIDDGAAATVSDIRAKALAIKRAHGLDIVALDHLGLLDLETGSRVSSPAEEMGVYSRAMKRMAKELDVISLVLAQPNRAYALRQDKHPVEADLRDSGKIANDADQIIGIYRQDLDDPENPTAEIDIEVLKNRAGKTGRRTFVWQGHKSRVVAHQR